MEVIGRGSVTIIDGGRAETDAWEVHGHRPVMISGVVLHALPSGYRFDLRHRRRIATDTADGAPRRGPRHDRLELTAQVRLRSGRSRSRALL